MVTVALATSPAGTGHQSRRGVYSPYKLDFRLDWAAAATAKGSALATGDVIEVMNIPANTLVIAAGIEIVTPATATDAAVDLGITTTDADAFVDNFDTEQAAGTSSPVTAATYVPVNVDTADTLDVLLIGITGDPSAGEIRVWAIFQDVSTYIVNPKPPGGN